MVLVLFFCNIKLVAKICIKFSNVMEKAFLILGSVVDFSFHICRKNLKDDFAHRAVLLVIN